MLCALVLTLYFKGLKSFYKFSSKRILLRRDPSKNSFLYHNQDPRVWKRKSISIFQRVIEETNSFQKLIANNTIILVDGDNVRGKTKFCVTKMNLLNDLRAWANYYDQRDCIILYFDHGSKQQAFYFHDHGIAVAFSGRKKADDVISRDVSWIRNHLQKNIVIITEDLELRQRCKRAVGPTRLSKKKEKNAAILLNRASSTADNTTTTNSTSNEESILSLYSVSSPSFVGILYNQTEQGLRPVIDSAPIILPSVQEPIRQHDTAASALSTNAVAQRENAHVLLDLFRQELNLREQVDGLQRLILRNSGKKKSRRAVADFKRKHRLMTAKLERFYSLNNHTMQSLQVRQQLMNATSSSQEEAGPTATAMIEDLDNDDEVEGSDDATSGSGDAMMGAFFSGDAAEEEMIRRGAALLSRAQMPAHKEETWQRVILAEEMRRDLIAIQGRQAVSEGDSISIPESLQQSSLLEQYVRYYNSL